MKFRFMLVIEDSTPEERVRQCRDLAARLAQETGEQVALVTGPQAALDDSIGILWNANAEVELVEIASYDEPADSHDLAHHDHHHH